MRKTLLLLMVLVMACGVSFSQKITVSIVRLTMDPLDQIARLHSRTDHWSDIPQRIWIFLWDNIIFPPRLVATHVRTGA